MIQLSCCTDYASERNESLLSDCRVQLILLQRYAFLLKEARNYWKMFEGEGDKKKKVYPACTICWARRIHLIIYIRYTRVILDCLFHNLCCLVSTLQDKQAGAWDIVYLEFRVLHLAYLLTLHIIYIGVRSRDVLLNRNGRDSRSAIL